MIKIKTGGTFYPTLKVYCLYHPVGSALAAFRCYAVFTIADLLERVVYRAVTVPVIERTILILVLVVIIRFVWVNGWGQGSILPV